MVYIYVLKCKENKYYVGKTSNPSFRLDSHFKEGGSVWTKMYKPIKVIKLIKDCSKYDEDKYVLEYMEKYDIDNVRGGTYSQIELTDDQIHSITEQMVSANDMCKRCFRKGHFVKNCYAKTDIDGNYIKDTKTSKKEKLWYCEFCGDEFTSFKKAEKHEANCYTFVDYPKQVKEENTFDKALKVCEGFLDIAGKVVDTFSDNKCYRCGREGHYASECYAKKHIKGYYIRN